MQRHQLTAALAGIGAAFFCHIANATPVLFTTGQQIVGSITIAVDGSVSDYGIASAFSGIDYTPSNSTAGVSYTQGGSDVTEFSFTSGGTVLRLDAWFGKVLPGYFPLNEAAFAADLASLPNDTAVPLCTGACTLMSPGLGQASTETSASGPLGTISAGFLNFTDGSYTLTLSATPVGTPVGTPEPATIGILIPGLLALAFRVRPVR